MYLRRACELAARGRGGTAPNPCVGAVIVRGTRTLGEGFHRAKGEPHAEVEAVRAAAAAGNDVRGATAYVSLEPCNHHGATPPCSEALIAAGIARVVAGALDPNPRTAGGGVARLRDAGIVVDVARDALAADLIEDFAVWVRAGRPYVRLKMASSLDGYATPEPGPHRLTGPPAAAFVRDLRAGYDAVMVGAGTLRADDPLLTVRPPAARHRLFRRIVVCGAAPPGRDRRAFAPLDGYAPTLLLVPEAERAAYDALEGVAEIVVVQSDAAGRLDLGDALRALHARGVASILCEGGPRLAASLLAAGLVDRLDWLVAPVLLAGPAALPALAPDAALRSRMHFERVERLGDDLLVSGRPTEA